MKPSGRYTILVADRSSGVVRRATVPVRPAAIAACVVAATPILIGMGAAWKSYNSVADLRVSHQALEVENANYREATEALAGQITSLQGAIADLGDRSALDPNLARAMNRLPAIVKSRAMGGTPSGSPLRPQEQENNYARTLSALASPDDTFGLLRTLLDGLQNRLNVVALDVDKRNALAAATPSMWPSYGWLSSGMGPAAGTVEHVGRQGAYGNLIVIDHGFGLETRYGHLLKYNVKQGAKVQRGDVIGQVGATGRATGYHLHYEVVANGRLINPLQLLTQKPRDR
jgi:hypothetical protein